MTRTRLTLVFSYFLAIVCLLVIGWKTDFTVLFALVGSSNTGLMVLALFTASLVLPLHCLLWRLFLTTGTGLTVPKNLFSILSIWGFADQILPFRMSQGIKFYLFGVREGLGKTRILSALMAEEVSLGGAKGLFFVVALSVCPVPPSVSKYLQLFLVLILIFMAAVLFAVHRVHTLLPFDPSLSWKQKAKWGINNWFYHMHSVRNPKLLMASSLIVFLILAVHTAVFLMVSRALGVQVLPAQGIAVIALLNGLLLVMVTPGNYGLFEGVSTTALGFMGIPSGEAFSLSLVFHAVLSFPLVLIGGVMLFRYGGFSVGFTEGRRWNVERLVDKSY